MAEPRSPFQGLGFYTEDDARWFFGRATERKIILAHLRTARLTLLYAESGVGKSSLLRAGVAARLRELAMQNIDASRSPKFVPLVFSAWKDDPVEDLIAEIRRQVHVLRPASNGDGPAASASNGGLAEAIATAGSALDATLVIILDQFEEHFSYRLTAGRPDRLADELAQCVNSPTVPANFLIAVREDAYGGLGDLFSGRISNVYNNYLHLEYLTREAALEAIEKPVEIYNADHPEQEPIALDEDLADAVLDEVKRGNIELGTRRADRDGGTWPGANADEIETPFLQLVMTRLWECELAKGSRVLRTETLNDELGGAETIVRNHVDRALMGLAGEELEAATDIFHDLVTPSGVKVAHTARDLAQMTAHSETTVGAVLDRLYDERIVRAVDPAPGSGQARYEIFHDRLAAPILDWRQQRENARLDRARERAEQEAEVQRTQARRFKRRARIMFALAVGLLVLLVAVAVLLGYARHQTDTASRERGHQATYFGLASSAQLAALDPAGRVLAAVPRGVRPEPGSSERADTSEASRRPSLPTRARARSASCTVTPTRSRASPSAPVGSTLASASGDRTVSLWTVRAGGDYPARRAASCQRAAVQRRVRPHRPDPRVWELQSTSSSGASAVTSSSAMIPDDSGAITDVTFSPVGTLARRRRVERDGAALEHVDRPLARPEGSYPGSGAQRRVQPRRAPARGQQRQIGGPVRTWPPPPARASAGTGSSVVYALAFSRDGHTLAAGGSEGQIVFFDPATRTQSRPPLSGMHIVNSLAFDADGKTLVAGGASTTVLWNLAQPGSQPERLLGHHGGVNTVAFNPQGTVLASAGADRTITLWNYPPGELGRPLAYVPKGASEVAVSPAGSLIAAGGPSGQISLIKPPYGQSAAGVTPPGRPGRPGRVRSLGTNARRRLRQRDDRALGRRHRRSGGDASR